MNHAAPEPSAIKTSFIHMPKPHASLFGYNLPTIKMMGITGISHDNNTFFNKPNFLESLIK
ncbi:hypothetical protein HYS31_00820 [Candidatus Woesearchaeota archaeon]|nr:hypothetical protein [Candidatus Woesearchaeota archaeon]